MEYGYYKNIVQHKLNAWILVGEKIIRFKDSLETIDWKIDYQAIRKIGKYKCIQAKGVFRGRNFTAWFCPEIPFSHGPWKLWGLPGLILEASDEAQQIQFLFQELDLSVDTEIKEPSPKNRLDWQTFNQYILENNKVQIEQLSGIRPVEDSFWQKPIFKIEKTKQ
ncbi:MAG: GLPGLI family protein [Microscillaceae bacterium]|nr:GLPGLI family protein [Microscillaceae bacterium]